MNKEIRIGDVICMDCGVFIRTFEFSGSVELFGNDKPVSHGYCKGCSERKMKEIKQLKEDNRNDI